VPADWLKDQADEGKVPCLKVDKQYLFNPPAVQAALAIEAAKTRIVPTSNGGDAP